MKLKGYLRGKIDRRDKYYQSIYGIIDILGEMVNLQKVNLLKSQPIHKMTKRLYLVFLASCLLEVDHLY